MILSFKGRLAEDLFYDLYTSTTKKFASSLRTIAQRKLQYLNAANKLQDLMAPAGNRLEALKGNFKGSYSIRINDQWRIIFRWSAGAYDVQIVDYHR